MLNQLKIFSGSSNVPLAKEICEILGISLGEVEISRFSNENISVQILECVREDDVFVIQSTYPQPSESIMELMLLCDALHNASAHRVTTVIPHYSYARSDKKDKPRISIAARLIANVLVTAGADRFLTMALHSEQVRGFFAVPTDHLQATPVICDYLLKTNLSNAVAVFDLGQDKRAGHFAERLGIPIAVIDKLRISDTEVYIRTMIGEVDGRDAIIFDDEISRGTSLVATIKAIKDKGAKNIKSVCTHGLFSGPAIDFIKDSVVNEIITTNTVNIPKEKLIDKITVLSVAPIFAEAIRRIHEGESISSMFI